MLSLTDPSAAAGCAARKSAGRPASAGVPFHRAHLRPHALVAIDAPAAEVTQCEPDEPPRVGVGEGVRVHRGEALVHRAVEAELRVQRLQRDSGASSAAQIDASSSLEASLRPRSISLM